MILIQDHLEPAPDPEAGPTTALYANRLSIAKRRWKGTAEDGQVFGFDLAHPLRHNQVFHRIDTTAYQLRQKAEPVLLVKYFDIRATAKLAWLVGNLHFEAAFEDDGMLFADDSAVRQMLERQHIAFEQTERVFLPPAKSGGADHHPH